MGCVAVLEIATDERVHAALRRFINGHPDLTGARLSLLARNRRCGDLVAPLAPDLHNRTDLFVTPFCIGT
jgi:hypothetical protein